MTVRELVVKLVLDSLGFRERVQDAQGELDTLGTVSKEATDKAARGMDKAADKADGLGDKARDAQDELDKLGTVSKETADKAARGMDKAADKADGLGDKAKEAGKSMQQAAERGKGGFGDLLGTLGKVAVALGGLAAIKTTVTGYVQAVTEIEKTSDMLGMSMEEWQGWAYAAKQAGLEAEDVRDRFMDLGDWMTDLNVNDAGPLKDFAEQTKTSFKDAKGATVSMEEGLMRLADTVGKMDRQQATSWLQQIGFDEKTTPLILKGRKAIEDYIKVGKEQALYTKRDAENARKMREAWQGVTYVYNAVSGAIMRALGPVFDWLAEKAGKVSGWVRENEDSLLVFITALAAVIARLLTPALWGMGKAALAAMGPFAPFIAVALALGAAFDELWAFASGGESTLEDLMKFFGMTDKQIEAVRQGVRDFIDALSDLWDFLTGKGGMPTWLDDMIPDWLKSVFSGGQQAAAAGIGGTGMSGPGSDEDDPMDAAIAASREVAARDRARRAAPSAIAAPAINYRAGDASRPAGNSVTNNRTFTTNVSQVTINTQATDAPGIARDFSGELQNQAAQADGAIGA